MKSKAPLIIGIATTIVVVGGLAWLVVSKSNAPGPYDALATCLKDKGAKFYGAFWCSHCQNQKKLFGASAKKLPYVECSTPDGKGQNPICTDKKINGYPTWEFADGSRESGELSFEKLTEKTGCELPKK